MKKKIFILSNVLILFLTVVTLFFINYCLKKNMVEYLNLIANKITKYIVNYAYESFEYSTKDLYEIIRNSDGEIKTIIYNTDKVNDLLSVITDNIYEFFREVEIGDLRGMNLEGNILTGRDTTTDYDGIILEVPFGTVFKNFLFSSLGPKIPVKVSLTGDFESRISTSVQEYGLNNALITVNVDLKVSERVVMPFFSDNIVVDNQIPIAISLVNGQIPNYYLPSFSNKINN